MRKVLNSLIVVFWVLAQTISAAQSHVHLPGHMMPPPEVHAAMQDHATHQHQHDAAKPGCPMHAVKDAGKSAEGPDTGDASKSCCKDMHCQSAAVLKLSSSSFSARAGDVYVVLELRHEEYSPSFTPSPPNTCS